MNRQTIMNTEVRADCYGGPTCDEVSTYFHTYCEGDMDTEDHKDDINISLKDLPPGARITVEYPCCPDCGTQRFDKLEFDNGKYVIVGHDKKCICGFDWEQWVLEQYS